MNKQTKIQDLNTILRKIMLTANMSEEEIEQFQTTFNKNILRKTLQVISSYNQNLLKDILDKSEHNNPKQFINLLMDEIENNQELKTKVENEIDSILENFVEEISTSANTSQKQQIISTLKA